LTNREASEERFLILAPTGRDATLTRKLLERAGLSAVICATLVDLCERFEEGGAAALLIAEEVFARSGLGPLREVLARQSSWSDIPIVIFTASSGRPPGSSPQQLFDIGNVILLERPLQPISMLSAARTALRARRRQYEARAELLAQQRAVRERDQFLAMLGHELRNPLSAIGMAMQLDGASETSSKYREIMRRQRGHLTRLVDDLLDVARVTSGKIVLRCEDVDLGALTQRCINQVRPALSEGTTLELAKPRTPVFINADPVRI
jgi:signal transduction histidine kinase